MTEIFEFELNYANQLLEEGKYKKAVEFAEKMITTYPKEKKFYKILISGYFKLNMLHKAYEFCVFCDDCPNEIKEKVFTVMSHS